MRAFIAPNHLLIQTDEQLDFSKLVAPLEERYCPDFGRPAIHPEVMVPAFLVCSLYNIASFRKLCSAISENIAFRWFCFLTIDDWEGQRQRKEVRPAGVSNGNPPNRESMVSPAPIPSASQLISPLPRCRSLCAGRLVPGNQLDALRVRQPVAC